MKKKRKNKIFKIKINKIKPTQQKKRIVYMIGDLLIYLYIYI